MSLLLVNVPVMPRWYAHTFIPFFFVYYYVYELSVTFIALNLETMSIFPSSTSYQGIIMYKIF